MVFQAMHELTCEFTLFIAMRQSIPFSAVHVVNRDKSWLAALSKAHVLPF